MAWILMAGCDGFGNDAYVASDTVFTDYREAFKAGVAITKENVSDFSKSEYKKQAKFAKKYNAADYEGGYPFYYAVPVEVTIH
jgi:hypothetical protein